MRLKAPFYIELHSINDLGRLVCALERAALPTFALTLNNDHIFAVQTDFINGRPVIYFAKNENHYDGGQYLAYRIIGGVEEVLIVNMVTNPTFVYSPIITIDKLPPIFTKRARIDKISEYVTIRLKDLSSLAKVAAYKTIYDEPPLPLLFYKQVNNINNLTDNINQFNYKFVIGATMNLSDSDTISYFYYVIIDKEPKDPFLRYSSQKVEQPSFHSKIDEHGYIYLKVIRLASNHPLVRMVE